MFTIPVFTVSMKLDWFKLYQLGHNHGLFFFPMNWSSSQYLHSQKSVSSCRCYCVQCLSVWAPGSDCQIPQVILDSSLCFTLTINGSVKHIDSTFKIQPESNFFLTISFTANLVQTTMISCLDYCLLTGFPTSTLLPPV